jgi:mannose-1-phosphate guanylyltransferase
MAAGAVRGHVVHGYWNDLGTPERYLAANADVLAGRVPLARFRGVDPFARHRALPTDGGGARAPDVGGGAVWAGEGAIVAAGAHLRAPAVIGPGARVEAGATVGPFAVLGAGARVPRGAHVEHAVVWSGTALRAGERLVRGVAAGEERVDAAAPPVTR